MGAYSTTAVQKTYKEETITLYGRCTIGATSAQPTLITNQGASKGFTGVVLQSTPSHYEWTLESSINVCNILGFSVNMIRSPTSGLSSNPGLQVLDYTIGTAGTPTKIAIRAVPAAGGSAQLPQNAILELTLVITTSNIL